MLEVIKNRRSCRSYLPNVVEEDKINEIIEAGLKAPTGMNRQTPIFIVIKDKKLREDFTKAVLDIRGERWTRGDPFYGAPVVIMVLASKQGLSVEDGSAAIMSMLLEATNQELGCCWIHGAHEEVDNPKIRELLSFTNLNFDDYAGIGHVILGYKASNEVKEKVINPGRVFIK